MIENNKVYSIKRKKRLAIGIIPLMLVVMRASLSLIALGLFAALQLSGSSLDRYAYDALGRLTAVSDEHGVAKESYRYDGVGNIVGKTVNGESCHMHYDAAHQLKSTNGPDGLREFLYDDAGRLTTETMNGQPVVEYTYGYLDKVIAVERNGCVTRFDYDAQGMLVGKQLPDGSYERWTWDGLALVARGEERYINEAHITGGLPIVSRTSEGVRYHQHDHLGTTVASYTAAGELAATYEATVFGDGDLAASRAARFTGKPYDVDLGAYVFPFRNYKPEAARWTSADPAGFPDGPNNHFYAPVPTLGVDPWGLRVATFDSAKFSGMFPFTTAHVRAVFTINDSSFTISYDSSSLRGIHSGPAVQLTIISDIAGNTFEETKIDDAGVNWKRVGLTVDFNIDKSFWGNNLTDHWDGGVTGYSTWLEI